MRVSKLILICFFGAMLAHCSNSDFAGSDKSKKNQSEDNDEDENEKLKSKNVYDNVFDREDGLGDGGQEALEDFINSGDKIATGQGGAVLERFDVTETDSPADIAIIIDTSGSMDNEIVHVENNLAKFMDDFAADPKTEKAQLFVLAGRDKETLNPPAAVAANDNFTFSNSGHEVDSHNAMSIAQQFLSGTIVLPKLKLRPEAAKHLVFITDDEAEGVTAPELRTFLQTNHKEETATVHAIVCLREGGECQETGQNYITLANEAEFKGTVQDLQTANWGPLFQNLAASIQAKIDFRFELSKEIGDDEKAFVFVEGKKLDESDFEVDGNFIEIDTDAIDADDEVVVLYFENK